MPTLGEIKAAGGMPSIDQIRSLEYEESRNCSMKFGYPHTHHCWRAKDKFGRWGDVWIVCPAIDYLHDKLEAMFPGLKIERYKE